ncbi:hypothetical protein P3T35_007511 [Kitasatospora sp. GP30]|uniref:hypothetical protein n=1 Tax=Kitasatospora sp. GP30 TaxID=3035084 RepID=UPI000CB7C046|nr:hypothetical protein [Kitasatospora sp. GP30]MDH6145456.1 hypothetical protein [Kitasatospora sp. GP30]
MCVDHVSRGNGAERESPPMSPEQSSHPRLAGVAQVAQAAGRKEGGVPPPTTATARKGGPGRTVLVTVLVAIPLVKIAWTVGSGDATREVVSATGLPAPAFG